MQAPASAAIRAEISALRGKISKLPGKKNAKARKTINRSIRELEGALAVAEQDLAPYQAHEEVDPPPTHTRILCNCDVEEAS